MVDVLKNDNESDADSDWEEPDIVANMNWTEKEAYLEKNCEKQNLERQKSYNNE